MSICIPAPSLPHSIIFPPVNTNNIFLIFPFSVCWLKIGQMELADEREELEPKWVNGIVILLYSIIFHYVLFYCYYFRKYIQFSLISPCFYPLLIRVSEEELNRRENITTDHTAGSAVIRSDNNSNANNLDRTNNNNKLSSRGVNPFRLIPCRNYSSVDDNINNNNSNNNNNNNTSKDKDKDKNNNNETPRITKEQPFRVSLSLEALVRIYHSSLRLSTSLYIYISTKMVNTQNIYLLFCNSYSGCNGCPCSFIKNRNYRVVGWVLQSIQTSNQRGDSITLFGSKYQYTGNYLRSYFSIYLSSILLSIYPLAMTYMFLYYSVKWIHSLK